MRALECATRPELAMPVKFNYWNAWFPPYWMAHCCRCFHHFFHFQTLIKKKKKLQLSWSIDIILEKICIDEAEIWISLVFLWRENDKNINITGEESKEWHSIKNTSTWSVSPSTTSFLFLISNTNDNIIRSQHLSIPCSSW